MKVFKRLCLGFTVFLFFILMLFLISGGDEETNTSGISGNIGVAFTGTYTEDLPLFTEIKGTDIIPDEIAQLAVGTAVKYKLLPSVILSQWAYESAWGKSSSAQNDVNFFGITWFKGCPFPQGSARGVNGSEGGYYMKFNSEQACFSYYGYMVAKQSNFNACVGNQNPSECLLILGKGGYAASGITEASPYFTFAMDIIKANNLTQYDAFAIERWDSLSTAENTEPDTGKGDISILNAVLGQTLNNGECYGLTAYYVEKMGGPTLMGSGFMFAERIGEDYHWEQYGWEVILNPEPSDLQKGDVINWQHYGGLSRSIYGHTGVISNVTNGGQQFDTYEQNSSQGRICAQYSRTYDMNPIVSLVRKVE